ncbi:DUF6777 domain-containing protein [Streptomyces sp. NPDC057271]|uniref:DUF6777 domain-containing protein n=1 Tax=unclassified Streptomyces TaxID=2593676 RepID=UPI003634B3C8
MPSPIRRSSRPHVTAPAVGVLAVALVLAGCAAGDDAGEGGAASDRTAATSQEVFLQPVADRGPDPFTASTARAGVPSPAATAPPGTSTGGTIREVTGSTPGLYGGTRQVASCDVERQAELLARDRVRTRVFAESAGIPEAGAADWLRGLTPVVLRADTRVTNHGYRDGGATAYQSVLQAGTAVLVDQYGAPRVRCACGNPLRSPVTAQGATHQGKPWSGYHPDRVVVIRPTTTVVTSLVIVNTVDNTWIERKTGTDGERDTRPAVIPPCAPAACDLTGTPAPVPSPSVTDGSPDPGRGESTRPDGSTPPGDVSPPAPPTTECPAPDPYPNGTPDTASPDATAPDPSIPPDCPTPPWPEPPVEPQPEPEPESDAPSFEDLFPMETAPRQPETFEG